MSALLHCVTMLPLQRLSPLRQVLTTKDTTFLLTAGLYAVLILQLSQAQTTPSVPASGCRDGSTEALQTASHPRLAACEGVWVGHIENASSLCAPGWSVCGWRDKSLLKALGWAEATAVPGCYALNAAQDGGTCQPCESNSEQDDLAGIGRGCPHQDYGQRSCISGGKIDVSCCSDSRYRQACQYRPGMASGVLCCTKQGIAPQILVRPQPLTHVTSGVTFVLSCQAMGDPAPQVYWLRNGIPAANNNSRIAQFSSGYLLISSAQPSDSGDYKCVVSNSVGQATAEAHIQITDHPSGCADGTTDALAEFETIQGCKGSWSGHVKRGRSLCKNGWHVCNPKHADYLRLLTWSDVTGVNGCYAYNVANSQGSCDRRCHRDEMAGIGKHCGKYRQLHESCLGQGRVDVFKQKRSGCDFTRGQTTGVLCCKRPKKSRVTVAPPSPSCTPACAHGGRCVARDRCECSREYKGAWCQHPVCYGGCVPNSYCIKPGVCRCRSGYTFDGDKCTKRVRPERRKCKHPCFNGGLCKHGNCKCAQPYFGKMCQHGGSAHVLILERTAKPDKT